MRKIGYLLAWGAIVAAFLDALENAMLLSILYASEVPFLPPLVAGIAAAIKFLLLIFALAYWPISLGTLIFRRRVA